MCSRTILTETKVFPGFKCQSFDLPKYCVASMLIGGVGILASLLHADAARAVTADTSAVMMQCRDLSSDQTGFDDCLEVIEIESERALLSIESEWLALAEQPLAADDREQHRADPDQLRVMAAQYRDYRDQLCDFSAKGLDPVSAVPAVQACRISLNRDRVSFLQQHLIEHRTRQENGSFYRGYFLMTENSGLFQSCELRQDWVVEASDDQLEQISERYMSVTSESLELVYIELRGRLVENDGDEPIMRIERLNLLRPILDSDCTRVKALSGEITAADEQDLVDPDIEEPEQTPGSGSAAETTAIIDTSTIDDFGSAGFMYGYFGDWTSACAADAQQVCQAQAGHSLSTEGDWLLLIDRSADLLWRVRLMPTTNSHSVGGAMQLSLNGVALTTATVSSGQITLNRPQTLLRGDEALQFINRMKQSGTLEMSWNSTNQSSTSLIFSLSGVTLAVNYFDTHGN